MQSSFPLVVTLAHFLKVKILNTPSVLYMIYFHHHYYTGSYLDQEKYAYIQDYLKKSSEQSKDIDTHSVTAKTSDSGMLGPNSASSESGTEITSGKLKEIPRI